MSSATFRSLAVLLFAGVVLGCRSTPDPEERARRILAATGGDRQAARQRWSAGPGNRTLGLSAQVAWRDPRRPLLLETTRELRTGDPGDCAPSGDAAPVFYRTLVAESSGAAPLAAFVWPTLDDAAAGHRAVRAAAAAARGDERQFWLEIEHAPRLERACNLFRGYRTHCAGSGPDAHHSPKSSSSCANAGSQPGLMVERIICEDW